MENEREIGIRDDLMVIAGLAYPYFKPSDRLMTAQEVEENEKIIRGYIESGLKKINIENQAKFIQMKALVNKKKKGDKPDKDLHNSKSQDIKKTMNLTSTDNIVNNISSLKYKNNCRVCKSDMLIKCIEEHPKFAVPIRYPREFPFGPLGFGEKIVFGVDDVIKFTNFSFKIFHSYDGDYYDPIKELRMGIIQICEGTSEEIDMVSTNEVNTLGIIKHVNLLKKNNKKPKDAEEEVDEKHMDEVIRAINEGVFEESIVSDAMIKYKYFCDETSYTIVKPNIETILRNLIRPNGNQFRIINKAYVLVRKAQINSDGKEKVIVEPVYFRFENELNKVKETPFTPDTSFTNLIRLFYTHNDEIRGFLVRTEDIMEKCCEISALYASNDKHDRIYDVMDRCIALKFSYIPENIDSFHLKEYRSNKTVVSMAREAAVINEINAEIRFRTKTSEKDKHKNLMDFTIDHEASPVITIITLEKKDRGISEKLTIPNLKKVFLSLAKYLMGKIRKNLKPEDIAPAVIPNKDQNKKGKKKKESPKPIIDLSLEEDLVNIDSLSCICQYQIIIDLGNNQIVETVNVEEIFKFTHKIRNTEDQNSGSGKFLNVNNLIKWRKDKRKLTQGTYRVKADNNEVIYVECHNEESVEDSMKKNQISHRSVKEILKSVLIYPKTGQILGEIEMKTKFNLGKSENDEQSFPVNKFTKNYENEIDFETVFIIESQSVRNVARLLVFEEKFIKVSVTEPNIPNLLSGRWQVSGNDSTMARIKNLFPLDLTILRGIDMSQIIPTEYETQNSHYESCPYSKYGTFAIRSNVKVIEGNLNNVSAEIVVEKRDEIRLVECFCPECPEGKVMLDNANSKGEACNLTLVSEKLSKFEFLSAFKMLEQSARIFEYTADNKTFLLNRFKHKIQRSIFNTIYHTVVESDKAEKKEKKEKKK